MERIMYIKIDKNRKQAARYSGYAGTNTKGAIKVDRFSPSDYHKLKTDYKKFKDEKQWELDTAAKAKHERRKKLQQKYDQEKEKLIWNEVKKNKENDLDAEDLLEVDKKIKGVRHERI